MAAIDRLDEHLTPQPSRIVYAARELVHAIKAERAAIEDQDALNTAAMQRASLAWVTQDQIDHAGKRVKATRLAKMAAEAVLEKEVDR